MASAISKAISFQSVSVVIKAFSHLAIMVVLGRYLSAAEFGLVASAQLVVMLLQTISEAGVSSLLIQKSVVSKGMQVAALVVSFLVGLAFFLCVWWLAPIAENYFDAPGLIELIRILSFGFILIGISGVFESLLQREMRFDVLLKVNFLSHILAYMPTAIILAVLGYGAKSIVIASILQLFVKSVSLVYFKQIAIFVLPRKSDFYSIVDFGGGVVLTRIATYLYKNIDKLLIGKIMGQEALGLYHLATQLILLPLQYLGDIVGTVFFPVLSRLNGPDDSDKFIDVVVKASLITTLLLGAATALFVSYSDLVVGVIYGSNWEDLGALVAVLSPLLLIRGFGRIIDVANLAIGKVYKAALVKGLMALLMAVGVYLTASIGDLHYTSVAIIVVSVIAWLSLAKLASLGGGFSLVKYLRKLVGVVALVLALISLMFFVTKYFKGNGTIPQVIIGQFLALLLYVWFSVKFYFRDVKQLIQYKM